MTQTNPGYLTTLSASPSSRIVDGTDNIHSGIINSLNVASGGNAVVDGFDITQEDGGDYTRYVITSGKILRNGLFVSVSGATITPTAGSRSGNDWYATVVVAANNSLAIRVGAKDLSTASVSVLTAGDIPIAIVKYVDSSANDATNRLVQFLGYDQTTKGFSAINSGSETLRINADGTLTKGGSGTITLPASGTLATTSQVAYTSAIAEGNSGLVPSGGVASGNIANGAVTYGKMQNVSATNRILGRDSSGAGVVEEITPANVRTMLGIETGATADQTDAEIETAYNTRVAQVSNAERTSGSATDVRRFSPADIKSMIDTHETDTNTDTDVSVANLKSKLSSDFGGDFTIGTQSDDTATISGNLVVGGNLTISGSTTTLDTETVALQDNILLLNSNSANTPSENAGVEVERGNSSNVLIRWNESTDRWEFTNDGSNYHNLAVTSELSGSAYTHPNSVVADITTSGADVVQTISTNATGHVTALSKRTLSLGDLGYTGAADANKYVHPNHSGDVTSSADGATTIADNAVTSAKIATNAVTATEIANTTITNAQISNTAAIAQSKIDGLTAALSGKEPSLTISDGLDRTGSTLKIDIDGLTTENGMDRTADFIMYDDATENSNELRKINLANIFSKLIAGDIPDISSTYRATATTLVNADISSSAAINADKIADGSTNKVFTSTLKTKLDGIATGATAGADWSSNVSNISVATAQIADSAVTNVKLANSGVTINSNSLNLGGTLTLDTDDFAEGSNKFYTDERVDDRVNALITDGEGITTTYDDSAGTLTVAAELATDSNKGVASFTNSHFVVNSGVVAIKDSSITNGKLAGSIAQSKITNLVSNLASKIENLGDLSVTASAAELNLLDGVPAGLTTTEIGYLDGVTSSIQTQLDSKLSSVAISDITGISSLDTDIGTTSANNDTLVSALAVKNYVDSKTTDLQTYSLLATDYTEGTNRAQITLRDSESVDNHVVIAAGDGINVTRNGSNIVIVNSVLGETVTGAAFNQGVLTLTQQDSSTLTATLPDATTDAHGLMTDTQFDKLAGIEALADVTDKANVVASLALLDESDTLYLGDAGNDTTVRVRGNLFVDGTTTTINQTEINVQDAFVFEGATGDDYETTLRIIDPTADRVISLPDITGTVVTTGDSQTVATGMIANLGVTTGKINSNAVTSGKLATDAVITAKIQDDAVTTAKIVDDAVTIAKIDGITDAGSGSVITSAERTKLGGIATGAEVNVQSDWNASSGDAKILNKPNVQYTSAIPDATASQTGLATSTQITKLDAIEASADVTDATNVNAAGAFMHTDIPDSDTGFIKRTGSETYDIDTSTYLTSLSVTGLSDVAAFETNFADGVSVNDDSLASAKSIKAYVDSVGGAATGSTTFQLEDGDGTELTISHGKEIKFVEGALIDINWTDVDNGTDADPWDLTFTVDNDLANYDNSTSSFATTTALTNATAITAITGKVLTNLATGSGGTVAATDTILAAFGKLENRVALNDVKVTNTDVNVNVANLTARLPQITESVTIGDATDVTVTTAGGLVVTGNLTVNGTTTTIDTNTVNIGDNILVLNSDATGSASQDAGIEVERGDDSNKTLIWEEGTDKWTVGSENFTAGTFTGNLTGNVTGNADTATEATNVTATANNSTDETVYPVFVDGTTGTQGIETDSGFTYNPSSGLLSTAGLTASGTIQYGSLSDGSITVTAFESSLTSGATLVPTSAAVKTYVDAQVDTADSFSEMADVSLTSPAAGHLAIYDATQSRWENATLTAGTNVSITNADAGITIASTDTTYTATATKGLALSGTAFSLDDPDNTNIQLMSSGANGSASNPAQRDAATGDEILIWDISANGGNGEWAFMSLSHLADFAVDNGGESGGIKVFKTITVSNDGGSSSGSDMVADATADTLDIEAQAGIILTAAGGSSGNQKLSIGVNIDTLTAGTSLHQTEDHFMFSDNGTEKKVTFSDLEDAIFANVSGDATIAAGGALTIAANSVALGTDTTGNYMTDVSAGTGIDITHTAAEGSTATIAVDVSDFMTNGADNYVLTATGADGINAESGLYFDGNLGINTSSPTARLHINNDETDASVDAPASFGIYVDHDSSGSQTTGNDDEQGGIYVSAQTTSTGGDASDEHRLYGIWSDTRTAASSNDSDFDEMIGVYGLVKQQQQPSSGITHSKVSAVDGWAVSSTSSTNDTITNLYASKGLASVYQSGTVSNVYGGKFQATVHNNRAVDTGAIFGMNAEVQIDANNQSGSDISTGTVKVVSSVFDDNQASSPDVTVNTTNSYLYYGNYSISNTGGITNKWGLYLSNADKHYLSGNVEIGGDLTVTGNDIKSSTGATVMTLSADDVTFASKVTIGDSYMQDDGSNWQFYANDQFQHFALGQWGGHLFYTKDGVNGGSNVFQFGVDYTGNLRLSNVDNKLIYMQDTAHDAAGKDLTISAGDTTAGTTNNIAGGDLIFEGGIGKGTGAGGAITFKVANAGSSGSSLNSLATALTISDDTTITTASTLTVGGDLIVSGSTTTVNSNTVNIGDSIITLNSDETGTPSQDAGIEVERGTSTNKSFYWDESEDEWTIGSENFKAGSLEGALTGNASTATALATARDIHGVSFDGSANIDLTEVIQDTVGAMFTGNTETNITATYQDDDGTIDLVTSSVGDGLSYNGTTANGILTYGSASTIDTESTLTYDPAGKLSILPASGYGRIEMGGSSGAYIDMKNDSSDDYDARLITDGTGLDIITAGGSAPISLRTNGTQRMKIEDAQTTMAHHLTFGTTSNPYIKAGTGGPLSIWGDEDGLATSYSSNTPTYSTAASIQLRVNASNQTAMEIQNNKDIKTYGFLKGGSHSSVYGANTFIMGTTGSTADNDWFEVFRWTPKTDGGSDNANWQYDNFQATFQVTARGIGRSNFNLHVRGEYGTQDNNNGWWTKEFIIDGWDDNVADDDTTFKMVYNAGTGGSTPYASLYQKRDEDWEYRQIKLIQCFTNCYFDYLNTNVGETEPTHDTNQGSHDLDPSIRRKLYVDGNEQLINGLAATGIYFDDTNDRLGVGMATPQHNLDIWGSDASIRLVDTSDSDNSAKIVVGEDSSVTVASEASVEYGWEMHYNSSGNDFFELKMMDATNGDVANALVVDRFGKVGIGTDSPGELLHLSQAAAGDSVSLKITNTDDTNDSSIASLHLESQRGTDSNFYIEHDAWGVTKLYNGQGSKIHALTIAADGSVNAPVAFSATTKSFDIEHPTEEGKRLHHGSLEGPEHGVYIRGRLEGDTIELPDYWLGLVDEDTITVQLTPNKGFQQIYVDHIEDNKVFVGTQTDTPIDCFYFIQAERKDVEKMVVEY